MSVWFTSDLHFGHLAAAQHRGFNGDRDLHDFTVVENINKLVNKRDKLFILGDLAFSDKGMQWANNIQCRNIELIMGNHDKYPVRRYLQIVDKVHGFRGYKDFWLSHCPIHPNEMYRKKGNIHGHVHSFSNSPKIGDERYFNVNIDCTNMQPVSYAYIENRFDLI